MHANIVTFYFLFFLETFWLACKTSHRKSRRRKSGIQISTLKLLGNELTSQSQQPYLQGLVALTGLSLKQMLHWKYSRQLSPSLKYCQPRCSGTLSRIQGDWLDKQMKTIHGSIIYKHLEKKVYILYISYIVQPELGKGHHEALLSPEQSIAVFMFPLPHQCILYSRVGRFCPFFKFHEKSGV